MYSGAADFLTGERIDIANYFSENFDIHHIFSTFLVRESTLSRRSTPCAVLTITYDGCGERSATDNDQQVPLPPPEE